MRSVRRPWERSPSARSWRGDGFEAIFQQWRSKAKEVSCRGASSLAPAAPALLYAPCQEVAAARALRCSIDSLDGALTYEQPCLAWLCATERGRCLPNADTVPVGGGTYAESNRAHSHRSFLLACPDHKCMAAPRALQPGLATWGGRLSLLSTPPVPFRQGTGTQLGEESGLRLVHGVTRARQLAPSVLHQHKWPLWQICVWP